VRAVAGNGRKWFSIGLAAAATAPALLVKFDGALLGRQLPTSVEVETAFFGLAILGSAFLLAWAAEVAQLDISQGLAIAFLAFIAVLPEYAVDLVFAWKAGAQDAAARAAGMLDPCVISEECNRQLAVANMTGANRLLIGLGWAMVVLVWWRRSGDREILLPEARRVDLGFLFLATVWAMVIVARQSATVIDSVVMVGLFAGYVWHTSKEEQQHPELVGAPVAIAALGVAKRRLVTIGLFVFSAFAILASAEPFAEGLKHTGERFNLDTFLLVQWVAPLASEAPEMIIAVLFVLRGNPRAGLGTLVSSKVNQWTLLVGTLPLVYAISYGSLTHGFHLGGRQVEEVFLTAAQSWFAVAVLANLSISKLEAGGLLVLFLAQTGFPTTSVRYGFAAMYMLLFVALMVKAENRNAMILNIRAALRRPRARGARSG
jgi:cation:H+ antiporter